MAKRQKKCALHKDLNATSCGDACGGAVGELSWEVDYRVGAVKSSILGGPVSPSGELVTSWEAGLYSKLGCAPCSIKTGAYALRLAAG